MAEFLTTSGTSYNIEKIIIDAKSELILVSPFLQLTPTLHERLKDALDRGVMIKIIYGKNELKPNEQNSLAELKNLELFYFQNLHAKCYFNEQLMVITSMNMYAFSEKTNREMGVLIDRGEDSKLFEKAVQETKSILSSSDPIPLRKTFSHKDNDINKSLPGLSKKPARGYCLRCEARIPYNPDKPYCADCYSVWVQYENADYLENVCHKCGEYNTTSFSKPQCYSCFNIWKKA